MNFRVKAKWGQAGGHADHIRHNSTVASCMPQRRVAEMSSICRDTAREAEKGSVDSIVSGRQGQAGLDE